MSGNFTRKSHLKENKNLSGNSETKFFVCLSPSHFKSSLGIDISGKRVCQTCACPRLPAQPEAWEDVIPQDWLEAFHWETPWSLFMLLPPPASLSYQTPKNLVTWPHFHLLFSHFMVCVCVCIEETSELINALRFPLCMCVSNLSPVSLHRHHFALIYYMVWLCQHRYQPDSLLQETGRWWQGKEESIFTDSYIVIY